MESTVQPSVSSDYVAASDARRHDSKRVRRLAEALQSRVDVWGRQVLALPDGPSYEAVAPYLVPSMLADPTYHTPVPYLPLGMGPDADSFALHLIDGSHIIAEGIRNWLIADPVLPNGEEVERSLKPARVTGANPRFFFSITNGERFGEQLDRLAEPTLAEGFLPVLLVDYLGADGVCWQRESFVGQADGPLVSWLQFTLTSETDTEAELSVRIDAQRPGSCRRWVTRCAVRTAFCCVHRQTSY
jgi:hypothetical protein